jgi:SecD/SecF fusion protein
MRRSSIKEVVNVSLWETIRRSIVTTIITLLPVGALLLFGGETLQDFAFAILVGISISALSTIFVAAPFLAVLLEMAPEYKGRRKDTGEADAMRAAADGRGRVVTALEPGPEPEDEPEVEEEEEAPVPTGAAAVVPPPAPAAAAGSAAAKRERRRQRRRARPHGRSR